MSDDTDWRALARYVSGACSDAERQAIDQWIAEDPARRETVEAARRIWETAAPLPEDWNVPAAWRALVRKEAATRERPTLRVVPGYEGRRRWLASPLWAAAAAAL